MSSQSDMKMDWDALNSAVQITSSLCKELSDLNVPISRHPLPHDVDASIPNLVLSVPHDVFAPLGTLNLPDDVQNTIIRRLERFINDLEQQYNSTYKRACLVTLRGMSSIIDIGVIHKAYQLMAQRQCIPMVRSQVSFILTEVAKRQPPVFESKLPFNNNFIPVLETYFELNGYPSVAHRSILAQKSSMTPRQIEVWFQNHRNRAKKDGVLLPRLTSDFPLRQALAVQQRDATNHQTRLPTPPRDENVKRVDNEARQAVALRSCPLPQSNSFQESNWTSTPLDDCYKARPPHAFPSTKSDQYPDPFPTVDGIFQFPLPIWRRRPTVAAPVISAAVDMDEFAQTFHLKLNFSENSRRRGTTPSKRESPPSQPWFCATTTTPSLAPHPALIQKLDVSRPASPSLDAFICKPIVFGPNFWRVDTSTAFLPAPPGEAPSRKTRPLPRRTPPRSPSTAFGSRTSSFSSDISSGSSASSSSSSYSSSPELSTPPPLPDRDLPVFHDDAQHQDYLFDFSQTDLDTDYPSASQTFDFSYTDPSLNKVSDLSFFGLNFSDLNNLGQIFP